MKKKKIIKKTRAKIKAFNEELLINWQEKLT